MNKRQSALGLSAVADEEIKIVEEARGPQITSATVSRMKSGWMGEFSSVLR